MSHHNNQKFMKLLGTGSYLPEKIVTNDALSEFVDTSDEWIKQRVGIHSRHFAEGNETTTNMAKWAALKALEAANTDPSEIGLVLVATATADYIMPSVASSIQSELGIPSCPAFDVNAACSGFVYMIDIAKQYIENGTTQKVLIVASERLSRIMDWKDRTTCVLFGDGSGAAVFGASEEPGVLTSIIHSDGKGCGMLNIKNSIPEKLYDNSAYATYMLQVGSYRTKRAADAVRARLILIGLKPDVSQHGDWYRIDVGPVFSKREGDILKHKLQANQISGSLLRQVSRVEVKANPATTKQ
ncbi:beta-ketoacyl-ACP synthase 3 [Francisellaceae bacterium]|nr:beta-ketoacyl-ACP synthase 3 [Francisellaceae bacterium]